MPHILLLIPLFAQAISPQLTGRESFASDSYTFASPGRAYHAVVEYETGNSEFVPFRRFELRRADGSTVYSKQGGGRTLLDISDQGTVVGIDFDGPVSGRAKLHFYGPDGRERGIAEVGFLKSRAFSGDGSTYGVDDGRSGVRVFRADGTELYRLGRANRFALSGNGRSLAVVQDDAVVLFRDGSEAGRYPLASPFVRDIGLSEDGAVLAWVDRFRLRILNAEEMRLVTDLPAPEPALRFISVDVSADGQMVAAGLDADAGRGSSDRHRRGLVMLVDSSGVVLWQEKLSYDRWNISVPEVGFVGLNSFRVKTADHILRYEY
jgi:hypothetical protein